MTLTGANRAAALLRLMALAGAEGASLGLCLRELPSKLWMPPFLAANLIHPLLRERLLWWTFGGAFLGCALALVFVLRGRLREGPGGLDRSVLASSRVARLLAPLLFAWAVPQMIATQGWLGRDVAYLVAAALLVVAFERALRVSLEAAGELELRARVGRFIGERAKSVRERAARLGPHVIVGACSAIYVVYMSYYTILQHLRRQTAGLDLGYFGNFFWNTLHGKPFYCPITHPADGSYLSIHAEFAVYLFAPLYALRQEASTLLVLQSALLGLSAIPLYLFARKRLGSSWLAALVSVAYLFYPPLQCPNFSDFHFLTITVFFIFWAAWFFETERWVGFWLAVIAAWTCREDVPFGGIAVGVALLFSGFRMRTGAALALLSVAYLGVVKFYVMPKFGAPSFVYIYEKLVAPGKEGFAGVLHTLLTNPLYTLSTIFMPEKLPYVLHVFVPLAFLPLRRVKWWFLLFPGFFVTLLSTGYLPVIEIRYQYVTHFTPYVFLAAVLVLEELGKTGGTRLRAAAAGALAAGTFLAAHQFGVFQRENFHAGRGKVEFDYTDRHREALRNLRELAQTIPREAKLAATEHDTPHLAERPYLYTLKYYVYDAEYLLYSYDDLDFGAARGLVHQALTSGEFGWHADRPGFVVLRRGAPTDRNADLVAKLSL